MEKNLKATQRRAVQYYFVDGLAELSGGLIGVLLAIYFIVMQILPSSQVSFPIIFLVLFVAAFGIRKLMFWYRERSTYPRTGFVEPKQGLQDPTLLIVAGGFTILLLGFMVFTIIRGIQTIRWMSIIAGAVLGFIFSLTGYRTRLARFYFLATFCLLLGVVLAFSGVGDFWGTALLCFGASLVLFAFGIVTRRNYLSQTQLTVEGTDER